MRWMSDHRGTVTCAPNFGYALAARAMRRLDGIDLSSWRLGLNGAEPIDPGSVERFLAAGARHGLDANSAFCVYGMAEATLAISFPEPGTGMTVDTVDRDRLELEGHAEPAAGPAARRLARLGRPLAGLEVRVCHPDTGAVCVDRAVGELELRGESVTPGYFRRADVTAAAHHDGWLRTGDLGYLVDGEVVVCGRIKDVIIIGGRNVFPEEIERAATAVEGVRAGNVVAFGMTGRRGKEGIVVVAETKVDEPEQLRDAVVERICDAVGVPPQEVVLVRAGSLPKTSSGKLQRSRCRDQYLDDELASA
jgi:fatty-acyl-CoA synthase